MSSRLQRSEEAAEAQAAKLSEKQRDLEEARSEIERLSRAREDLEAADARGRAERLDLDDEVVHLRQRLDIATGALREEKTTSGTLRSRVEALERELELEKERVEAAEAEAGAHSVAAAAAEATLARQTRVAEELESLRSLAEERGAEVKRLGAEIHGARAEAEGAASRLRAAEEAGRSAAHEASRARERLRSERESSRRVSSELEVRGVRCVWRCSRPPEPRAGLRVPACAAVRSSRPWRSSWAHSWGRGGGSRRSRFPRLLFAVDIPGPGSQSPLWLPSTRLPAYPPCPSGCVTPHDSVGSRQTAVRERTEAVEKLSLAEAEAGRLHVELAAAVAAVRDKKVSFRARIMAVPRGSAGERELPRTVSPSLFLPEPGGCPSISVIGECCLPVSDGRTRRGCGWREWMWCTP